MAIARQTLTIALAFDANSNHGLGCRARRTKHGDGGQGLVIELGDQEGLFGADFLPDLADLDSSEPPFLLASSYEVSENSCRCQSCAGRAFHPSRGNLFPPDTI